MRVISFRNALTCTLLLSGIFALSGAGWLAFSFSHTANSVDEALTSIRKGADAAKESVNQANGLIADSRKQLEEFGRTSGKIMLHLDRVAGEAQREQRQYYTELSLKTAQILSSADIAVKGLTQSEQEISANVNVGILHLNGTLDSLEPVLDQAYQTLHTVNGKIEALDVLSINTSLKNTEIATGNVATGTADIKDYIHRVTAPIRGFKAWTKKLLLNYAPTEAKIASVVIK